MTWFIFLGDMAVMAFMIGVALWYTGTGDREAIDRIARIPLDDDEGRREPDEPGSRGQR